MILGALPDFFWIGRCAVLDREYLRGHSLQERISRGSEEVALQSIAAFEEALRIDPGYALAWSGIADTYVHHLADTYWHPNRAYPLAASAAMRAIELDPNLGEVRVSLGGVMFWNGWDPLGALEELNRAIALSPQYQRAHWIRGLVLHALSRYEDAQAEWKRAAELDPSPYWSQWATGLHSSIRPPPETLHGLLDSLRAAVDQERHDPRTWTELRWAEYFSGDYDRYLELLTAADSDAVRHTTPCVASISKFRFTRFARRRWTR